MPATKAASTVTVGDTTQSWHDAAVRGTQLAATVSLLGKETARRTKHIRLEEYRCMSRQSERTGRERKIKNQKVFRALDGVHGLRDGVACGRVWVEYQNTKHSADQSCAAP